MNHKWRLSDMLLQVLMRCACVFVRAECTRTPHPRAPMHGSKFATEYKGFVRGWTSGLGTQTST